MSRRDDSWPHVRWWRRAPEPKKFKGGLLGADYSLENGRYRIAKVYDGENWNPGLQAPLTQPGVNVKAGDYILAVNGRDLHSSDNVYSFFEETPANRSCSKLAPIRTEKTPASDSRAGRE